MSPIPCQVQGTRHSSPQPNQTHRRVANFRKCVLTAPKAIFRIFKAVVYPTTLALEMRVTPAPREPTAESEAPFCNAQESHHCPKRHNEWKKLCYSHFTDQNRDTEKLSDLPKVTQEVCGQSQSHEAQYSALTTHWLLSFMW